MKFEEALKNEIEIQYGSVYHFSQVTKISNSTFTKISQSGIKSVSKKTLTRIAHHLGLDVDALSNGQIKGAEYTEEEKARFASEKLAPFTTDPSNPMEKDLLTSFRKLSIRGQFKVIDYVNDIMNTYKEE